jgi:predicted transcriptional regulator of viral defense system
MDDTSAKQGFACLFATATGQHGHVTTAQANECGISRSLLAYHVKTGRLIRMHRGVYRLRDYPSSWKEDVVAAWLAVGKDRAVVSHESALDLLELSDVIPNHVHLTVPRDQRYLPAPPGAKIHTTTRPLRPLDISQWEGVRITSATRTILDAAEVGVGPEQIEMAVGQAVRRGLTTRSILEQGARERGRRVSDLVTGALDRMVG